MSKATKQPKGQDLIRLVEQPNLKEDPPQFEIGDTVDVHTKILEGDKERIQVFSGVVIARSGSGAKRCSPSAASWPAKGWSGSSPSTRRGSIKWWSPARRWFAAPSSISSATAWAKRSA